MSDRGPEAAVVEVARTLVDKAIDGWARLIWRATLSEGAFEERVEVFLASGAPADASVQFRMGLLVDGRGRAAVQQLGTALRAVDGGSWHAVELTVEPGRVEAVASRVLTQSTGYLPPTYQVVVDSSREAHRVAREDTDPAESVVAGGDPHRVVELAEAYGSLYARAMGEPLRLRDPATAEEISSVEATLGVTFPPDLRALYRMADGEDSLYGLFGGPVRGLARARFPADVEAIQADYTIADQILPAFDGVRSLFLLLGLGSALDAAQRAAAWP